MNSKEGVEAKWRMNEPKRWPFDYGKARIGGIGIPDYVPEDKENNSRATPKDWEERFRELCNTLNLREETVSGFDEIGTVKNFLVRELEIAREEWENEPVRNDSHIGRMLQEARQEGREEARREAIQQIEKYMDFVEDNLIDGNGVISEIQAALDQKHHG